MATNSALVGLGHDVQIAQPVAAQALERHLRPDALGGEQAMQVVHAFDLLACKGDRW
jgi:hypothetical protein